jgi:hypothetical protein
MKIWESFFIYIIQTQNLLIVEQKVTDPKSLYELA